jgi:integrase
VEGDGRVLPLVDDLWDLVERRWAAREYRAADRTVGIADHVFHRRGRPLTDIDWAWRSARREAGLPGKLFHDFRRTAARDLVDAGMDYRSAMSVTGHKTQAVFERYRIVDARRTAEALKAMQTHRRRMRTVIETAGRVKNTDKTRQRAIRRHRPPDA